MGGSKEDRDATHRTVPAGALLFAAGLLSYVHEMSANDAFAWWPLKDVVVRSVLCPNPNPEDVLPLQFVYTLNGSADQWAFAAWALIIVTAVVGFFSPHKARRTLQWSLAFSTLATTLYGGPWLESALLGQGYTDVVSCDLLPVELAAAAAKSSYFRAVWPLTFAALLLPLLSYWDRDGTERELRTTWQSGVGRWRWAVASVLALLAILPLLPLAFGYPEMSAEQAFVVKVVVGYPLIFLMIASVGSLLPFADIRRAGIAAVQAAVALAFSCYTAMFIIARAHDKVVPEGAGVTMRSNLSERAQRNLDLAESYFFFIVFAMLWLGALSFLIGHLLLRPVSEKVPKLPREPPVVLLVGGKAELRTWLNVQRWAWSKGWHTTLSRQHAKQLTEERVPVFYIDFAKTRGEYVWVGRVWPLSEDPDHFDVDDLLSYRGMPVRRTDSGEVDGVALERTLSSIVESAHKEAQEAAEPAGS